MTSGPMFVQEMSVEARFAMLGLLTGELLSARVFVNDHEPQPTDTPGDYTVVQGAEYTLEPDEWYPDGEEVAIAYPDFEIGGPLGAIYGWVLLHPQGFVLVAERFEDAPHILRSDRDAEIIAVRLGLR